MSTGSSVRDLVERRRVEPRRSRERGLADVGAGNTPMKRREYEWGAVLRRCGSSPGLAEVAEMDASVTG